MPKKKKTYHGTLQSTEMYAVIRGKRAPKLVRQSIEDSGPFGLTQMLRLPLLFSTELAAKRWIKRWRNAEDFSVKKIKLPLRIEL